MGHYDRVTEEELKQMIAMRKAGKFVSEIAKALDRSESIVTRLLCKHGYRKAARSCLTSKEKEEIMNLHKQGYNHAEIRERTNRSHTAVKRWLKKAGMRDKPVFNKDSFLNKWMEHGNQDNK